ncbi:hypothetical protein SNE40_019535 [Patella caerulea]|uniref:Uncharacterized protein n=1 Tax=Patella caerulea TaxID=87958 RepID=A0AAN8JAQ2_PATCE
MKILLFLGLTMLSSIVVSQNPDRRVSVCVYKGRRYRHGEVVTLPRSPCARFRCEYNTLRLINQDCVDRKGQCIRVGQTWTESCITYRCSTRKLNNKQHYRGRILEMKCPDARGQCHSPGTNFEFRIGMQVYPSCTCRIWLEGQRRRMKYFC